MACDRLRSSRFRWGRVQREGHPSSSKAASTWAAHLELLRADAAAAVDLEAQVEAVVDLEAQMVAATGPKRTTGGPA